MLQREQGVTTQVETSLVENSSLWEKHFFADKSPFFFCPLLRLFELKDPATLYAMKGGIVADEMGLGKTITLLSLLLLSGTRGDGGKMRARTQGDSGGKTGRDTDRVSIIVSFFGNDACLL